MPLLPTVSATVLRPIVEYLATRGVSADAYLGKLGLSPAVLEDDLARVVFYRLLYMWHHAEELARDPDVGLHVAEHARFDSFGAVSGLAVASPTIGAGFRSVARSTRFLIGGDAYALVVRPDVEPDVARLRRVRMPLEPIERHSTECLLGVPHVYSARVSERPWRPLEVTFAHPRPASTAEHARIFGCPVRFEAKHDEVVFSASLLDSPSTHRDEALAARLTQVSDALVAGSLASEDLVGAVRVAAWARMREGDVSLEGIAKHLGMSTRTLQRRLAEEGKSHREVLDEVRALVAEHLVGAGSLTLADVAVMLGFSEQTAFQRAFKRWRGASPARFARGRG